MPRPVLPNLREIASKAEYHLIANGVRQIDKYRQHDDLTADDIAWAAEERKRLYLMCRDFSKAEERAGRPLAVSRRSDLQNAVPLHQFRL